MKRLKTIDWSLKRTPGFDRKGQGMEIQEYGMDASGKIVCAGVHWVPDISARYMWRLCSNWRRWRRWYDNLPENRGRDYPTKHDLPVRYWAAHPIDNPHKWFEMAV
jgi:hypothetical protein